MNKIVNKFLLAEDKFMTEMYLRQPGFTCLWNIYLNKERLQTFKEARDSWYIYQNELDKACFQHEMTWHNMKILKT